MLTALYEKIRKDALPSIVEFAGVRYSDKKIYPVVPPHAAPIRLKTLSGVVDYLNANVDKLNIDEMLCHVASPAEVILYSAFMDKIYERDCYITAELEQLQIPLNTYVEAEKFNIFLQACFVDPDDPAQATDRAKVLRYISNIKTVAEAGMSDDGTAQSVVLRKSVSSVEYGVLPNPVTLRPWRTFPEVEQPASRFVFRVKADDKGQHSFLLAEADGGAWKGEAMQNIKTYMQEHVPNLNVIA